MSYLGLPPAEAMRILSSLLAGTSWLLAAVAGFSQVGPESVDRDLRPVVRVHYEPAPGRVMAIRGSQGPLSWFAGTPMAEKPGHVWSWRGPAGMGGFEFKPLVDDLFWSTGANYSVPAGVGIVDVFPFFGNSAGTLQIVPQFFSPQLGNFRSLRIYLPPSYAENRFKRYPVLYMNDGQNLFDPATSYSGVEWRVDESFNHEIGNGRVREAIVVGVDNTPSRIYEYSPTPDPVWGGGGGDLYLDFLQDTVKPWVDGNYRTLPGAGDTFLMGSSLGGLISFYAGWTRPEVFGAVGCMSSSFWWDSESLTVAVETHSGPRPMARFYLDSGGLQDGALQTFRMRDALLALGYLPDRDLLHVYDPLGIHHESSWAARFPGAIRWLLPWE